jgi:hypothetical protein
VLLSAERTGTHDIGSIAGDKQCEAYAMRASGMHMMLLCADCMHCMITVQRSVSMLVTRIVADGKLQYIH